MLSRPLIISYACKTWHNASRTPTSSVVKSCRRHYSVLAPIHDTLVTFHNVTGLAWWLAIPVSTILLSLGTLPIAIRSRRQQIKIAALQPILDARSKGIAAQVRTQCPDLTDVNSFGRECARRKREARRTLHRKHHVSLSSILAIPALKIPLWLSFSMALRSMAGASIPFFTPLQFEESMRSEGIFWFNDLSTFDSLLIIPVTFGLLNLINIELSAHGRGVGEGSIRVVLTNVMRGASVAFIAVAAQMPVAVCLYWTTSVLCTLLQNVWLNHKFPSALSTTHKVQLDEADKVQVLSSSNALEVETQSGLHETSHAMEKVQLNNKKDKELPRTTKEKSVY